MRKTFRIALSIVVAVSALSLMAFVPLAQVQAAVQPLATRTPRVAQQVDQNLSFTLQREQSWLQLQQTNLTQAGQISARAQNLIDEAQAKGLDVTALQNALSAFNTQLAAATTSHGQAASILSARAGFDAGGNVTDTQTAHQTVLSARDALRQAHLTLASAAINLRQAVQSWRIQNGK